MAVQERLGVLVGGGPAPGINGVIGAATIEAINSGAEVIGIYDGFRWLSQGDTSHVRLLRIEDVSRIHFEGGSLLRTARDNPARSDATLDAVTQATERLGLTGLVTIGGDDTAYWSSPWAARRGT
jgi:6-phosphofructokinase 1